MCCVWFFGIDFDVLLYVFLICFLLWLILSVCVGVVVGNLCEKFVFCVMNIVVFVGFCLLGVFVMGIIGFYGNIGCW